MKFLVCSRAEAKKLSYRLKEPTLIISITDPENALASFCRSPWIVNVCRVSFDDVYADEEDGHTVAMRASDAKKIREYIDGYRERVDCIVIHCEAGISRSAGVMAAIQRYFGLTGDEIWLDSRYHPNLHCYRMMMEEFEKK